MAGSIQARTRASLQADLQSEIHWEMRDCLMVGFVVSPSAPLSSRLPLLASNLYRLCFGEVLVLVCNSGQLLLRCHKRPAFEAWGMLCALERACPSHTLPFCLISLPSANAFLTPPVWQVEGLFWCPYRYSRGSEFENISSLFSSFSSPCCAPMVCASSLGFNSKVADVVPLSRDSRSLWCMASSWHVWMLLVETSLVGKVGWARWQMERR